MIVSKLTLIFIVLIVLFSIFFANVALQLNIDLNTGYKEKITTNNNMVNLTISNSTFHLMWFLQVSDLHLSIFHDRQRVVEFEDFSCNTVSVIKPVAVLASGDLTDAKHRDNMGSGQYKEEWLLYNNALNKCNILNKTRWLDIRGNHDNFNVPGWKSHLNYFRNFSIQGKNHSHSYMHIINHNGDKYAFIGLDTCLEPGPRRPFNFIGILSKSEVKRVKIFLENAQNENVSHIIWFGHYPSSCIISYEEESVRNLIGNTKISKAYLCGHLHQIGGLVKEMYTLQRQGYLELELGDWKDNRMFRLAAIDHGVFSFVDIQHGTWPIVLITNPKHALFVMPERESIKTMKESTHIRLLAFSLSPIVFVQVKINNEEWQYCTKAGNNLYVLEWNPHKFSTGAHMIYVKVRDIQNRERTIEQPFSLDGTKLDFKIMAKFVLMINAVKLFQCMFGTMVMLCVLPLIILRYIHHRMLIGSMPMLKIRRIYSYLWLRRLWTLANVDILFYPLIIYEIYLIVGPWSVGEIIDGQFGAIFSWGIIVLNGVYLPGAFTYAYGFIQMFFCQFPLMLIFARGAEERLKIHWSNKKRKQLHLFWLFIQQIPFIFIISIQMVWAYFFWLAYGGIAFILGPLRTWSIFLNIYLWYKSLTLHAEATREVAMVWMPHSHNLKKDTLVELPKS